MPEASRGRTARRSDPAPGELLKELEQTLLRLPEWTEAQSRPVGPQDAAPTAGRDGDWAASPPVFVLIHSPLLGPTSWSLVAQDLARGGHQTLTPSLLGIANAPQPHWRYVLSAVRAATMGIDAPVVLVG
ncbi:MAG: hypothetical protein M3076_08665, partial [Actinomycetota bacterium]|nr:hypothetical protein [Actinomycetota bacterium]